MWWMVYFVGLSIAIGESAAACVSAASLTSVRAGRGQVHSGSSTQDVRTEGCAPPLLAVLALLAGAISPNLDVAGEVASAFGPQLLA